MTVAELSATMSAREFDQWKEYYQLEPFGQERDNWHMAKLATLYMQAHSKKKVTTDDFMYRSAEETRERETRATMAAIAALAKPKESD
jgi:hypothetical protein